MRLLKPIFIIPAIGMIVVWWQAINRTKYGMYLNILARFASDYYIGSKAFTH